MKIKKEIRNMICPGYGIGVNCMCVEEAEG